MKQTDTGMNAGEIISGFAGRMGKIALFDPLFELSRQRKVDRNGKQIAMMELGLMTLLFFFEKKLLRSHKTSTRDYIQFLKESLAPHYELEQVDLEDVGRKILQVFRPANGRKREMPFYNLDSGQEEILQTSILRTDKYDAQTQVQYYTLDEDGLELVFATKEFYMEFQLSIHQLLLRKQLEKGEFQGALRQIDEMQVDVETLRERIRKVEYEIKRNIVSDETFQRYRSLLEDIHLRLNRENEEFVELRDFVRETRDRIYADREQARFQRPYELILRISANLEKVHNEHTYLLQQSIELDSQALRAAKESLYYTGISSFNFDQDITGIIIGHPLSPDALRGVISPFLTVEQKPLWSLLTLFDKQQVISKEGGQSDSAGFLVMDQGEDNPFNLQRKKGVVDMLSLLLECAKVHGSSKFLLSDFIAYVRQMDLEELLHSRNFYDYWMMIHQRSPISAQQREQKTADESDLSLYEAMTDALKGYELTVYEATELLQVTDRYVIQDMIIELAGAYDAIS
ncbi:replicative DNA helicase [Paenibacillus sp. BJ-4]|uniref:replicative DNA helicase n=1 Tax=Paenibacillus sp. BJ-4 TaxID=2878097 RepID=UPI001CF0CCF7|nr:replicative DNA helicase [Paenibacillus sp. BJ-4]